jgi:hypothetical protein
VVDGIVYVADNMDDIMKEKSEHPKKTKPKNYGKNKISRIHNGKSLKYINQK